MGSCRQAPTSWSPLLRFLAGWGFAFSALACGRAPAEPAIGLSYNWAETGLVAFLQSEVDRRGGPDAMRVRVTFGDPQKWLAGASSPLAAEVNRAVGFSDDPSIIVAVGPGGSREALQVAPVYRRAGLAHLVPTATSRALASTADWTLLMAPNDSLQGEFIGAFADTALGARSAAIFYVADEYGIGLAAGTEATLAARKIRLLDRVPVRAGRDCANATDRTSYRLLVDDLARRGEPDVVVTALRSMECACLLRQLRERWPRVRLITGDGAYVDDAFLRRAGPLGDDSYYVAFWHPSLPAAGNAEFIDGFTRATGRAPRHGDVIFYDGVMAAAEAIRAVGPDRRRVWRYLRGLGDDRPAFDGLAGPVAFTPAIRRQLLMTHVGDGELHLVGAR